MVILALLLTCFFNSIIAGPVELEDQCRRIMTEAGLSEFFPQRVAQSIQSITVEDIRDYFEHDVTGENGIPTVNANPESEPRILQNAPLVRPDNEMTRVMKFLKKTLKIVGEKEKMWRGAGKHYDNVKKILTPGSPVCSCVTDIENNGLMMYLEQIAETLDQHEMMTTVTSKPSESTTAAYECEEEDFRCLSGRCIYNSWVCDGYRDCVDGSDEVDCDLTETMPTATTNPNEWTTSETSTASECQEEEFTCVSGGCTHNSSVCDGYNDCADESDEADCDSGADELNETQKDGKSNHAEIGGSENSVSSLDSDFERLGYEEIFEILEDVADDFVSQIRDKIKEDKNMESHASQTALVEILKALAANIFVEEEMEDGVEDDELEDGVEDDELEDGVVDDTESIPMSESQYDLAVFMFCMLNEQTDF